MGRYFDVLHWCVGVDTVLVCWAIGFEQKQYQFFLSTAPLIPRLLLPVMMQDVCE
jgi:hypothetical protein